MLTVKHNKRQSAPEVLAPMLARNNGQKSLCDWLLLTLKVWEKSYLSKKKKTFFKHPPQSQFLVLLNLKSHGEDLHWPGEGGCTFAWFFLGSLLKISGGGSSPRSILHSKAYRHWMYCFFSELAALLEVPTFRFVANSLHFLFLFTWKTEEERWV